MKLIHRIGYFSVGLVMGIIILIFFLSGKKTSCDYFPNARVLNNIRGKERVFSEKSLQFFRDNNIDTSGVSSILEDGDVDFSKSNTHAEPCKTYFISGKANTSEIELQIENCDSIATLEEVKFVQKK